MKIQEVHDTFYGKKQMSPNGIQKVINERHFLMKLYGLINFKLSKYITMKDAFSSSVIDETLQQVFTSTRPVIKIQKALYYDVLPCRKKHCAYTTGHDQCSEQSQLPWMFTIALK